MLSAAPTINMGGEGEIMWIRPGESADIAFTANDTDSPAATVKFYYDRDTNPDNGKTLITGSLGVSATQQTYHWTTVGTLTPGLYYVYGIVDDANNDPVIDVRDTSYVRLAPANPIATIETNMGRMIAFLGQQRGQLMVAEPSYIAPYSVANFVNYATTGFYNGLIFHRVVEPSQAENYGIIQGGGYLPDMTRRTPGLPIYHENLIWGGAVYPNGVGVLGMARTDKPHTATSEFYINLTDNTGFDWQSEAAPGYATFGYLLNGLGVAYDIEGVPTQAGTSIPVTPVVINSLTVDFPDLNINFGTLQGILPTVVYTDPDGTTVTTTLKGGYGMMNLKGDDLSYTFSGTKYIVSGTVDSAEIFLGSTSANSSLTFGTRGGDGRTNITRILGETALGKLSGPGVNITGEGVVMTEGGYVGSLTLNSLADGADLIMTGNSAATVPTAGVSIRINDIGAGGTISLASPIKSFYSVVCEAATFEGTWAKSFVVRTDFSSDLFLSGNANGYTLGSVKISGDMLSQEWHINGDIKSITIVGSVPAWSLTGDTSALRSIATMKMGDVGSGAVTTTGRIGSISALRWQDGAINADAIRSLKITGAPKRSIDGEFGADMTLDNDLDNLLTLTSASVAGPAGGAWKIAGKVGAVTIKGRTNGWSLTGKVGGALQSVKSLKLGEARDADLTVTNAVKYISAARWEAGAISVGSIGTMKITGNPRAEMDGDLGATMTLTGAGVAPGTYTLGSLTVRDALEGVTTITGNVKSIKLGTLEDNLIVNGNARAVTLAQTALTATPPDGGAAQLTVGAGISTIKAAGQKITTTQATTLYAATVGGYNFSQLMRYDTLAAWWAYNKAYRGYLGSGTGNLEAVVGAATESKPVGGANVDTFPVTLSLEDDKQEIQYWYYPSDQAKLAQWDYWGAFGRFEFALSDGLSFPTQMAYNQTYSLSSEMYAFWQVLDQAGNPTTTGFLLGGSATATVKWVGLQEVEVDGDTYLAAKLQVSMVMSGPVTLFWDPEDPVTFNGRYSLTQNQTLYSVPGIGIVQGSVQSIESLNLPGLVKQTATDSGTYSLADATTL